MNLSNDYNIIIFSATIECFKIILQNISLKYTAVPPVSKAYIGGTVLIN